MEPFTQHNGLVAPLDRVDVDTDQIIPKQFLKSIARTGFEAGLFYDWRTLPDRSPNPEFVLNKPQYQGASILVSGRNFGSGSSREHAPWALQQGGFRAVIAPSFGDIFRNNCYQTVADERDTLASFDIDPAVKHRILNGLDDIGLTLQHGQVIEAFERRRPTFLPRTEAITA